MKILFTLDQEEGMDSNDLIGDITIGDDKTLLSIKSTYLDSWLDVLIDGYKNLQNQTKVTLEIVEEPESITFEPVLKGFKITYAKQEIFFSNLNEFYQSLRTSAKELLLQLHQEQEHLLDFPLLAKIHHFTEQTPIQPEQKLVSNAIAV